MSRIRLCGAAVGIVVVVLMHYRPFVRMPAISNPSAGQVLVGESDGDHVRYVIGQRHSFDAVTLDYDVSFFGGGLISQLGGRATIAYVDESTYAGMRAIEKRGQCAAGYLNQCQANGRLSHFILIPANDEALTAMKRLKLKSGRKFRMTGSSLSLHSGRRDGQALGIQLGGTGCFLVESIAKI